ncbi:hypothetical protein CH267_22090 [Rhodococcus sp. 06-621-2]|nr:hypothetical protein CH267_22090 [Rhodococcus sp. 06-621-2]
MQFCGGLEPVHPSHRHDLIEMFDNQAEPEDLAEFLGARVAPPTISSREGDPIVFCEAQLELGELNGIRRKLSRKYGAAEGNRWHWRERSRHADGCQRDTDTCFGKVGGVEKYRVGPGRTAHPI